MVMYRDFATRSARRLGVVGTVKNLADGTVEVIAEGDESTLHTFIEQLQKGPMFSWVENVQVTWGESVGEYSDFTISY